jgi:hypothetical protein
MIDLIGSKLFLIFDTAPIRADLHKNSARFERLRNLLQDYPMAIAVPQVVFDEINAYFISKDEQTAIELENAIKTIKKQLERESHESDAKTVAPILARLITNRMSALERQQKTQEHLRLLFGADFLLLPYPQIKHELLVDRCLKEKRPFKKNVNPNSNNL